jgi:hypothetical protein
MPRERPGCNVHADLRCSAVDAKELTAASATGRGQRRCGGPYLESSPTGNRPPLLALLPFSSPSVSLTAFSRSDGSHQPDSGLLLCFLAALGPTLP